MKDVDDLCNAKRNDRLIFADYTEAYFALIRAEIWLEQFKTNGTLPSDAPALPRYGNPR